VQNYKNCVLHIRIYKMINKQEKPWYKTWCLRVGALGIATASFFEARKKDIVESPTPLFFCGGMPKKNNITLFYCNKMQVIIKLKVTVELRTYEC